jgi:hypothetical protein
MAFDKNVLFHGYKWHLNQNPWHLWPEWEICTMIKGEPFAKVPSKFPTSNRPYKPPSLTDLYKATFDGKEPTGQHNSMRDVEIMCEVYLKQAISQENYELADKLRKRMERFR